MQEPCDTARCAVKLSGAHHLAQDLPKSEAGAGFPAEIGVASLGREVFGREALLCFMFES